MKGLKVLHPVLVTLGPVKIYSWGFMLAVATLLAIWGISRLFAREGYNREDVLDMVLIIIVAGLLGARLAYVFLFEWQDFLANPLMVFRTTGGAFSGLVWYGGFTAGFLAFIIFLLKKGYSFWKVGDICAPFVALGYSLVRIGCFLNGCCYGHITTSDWGIIFPYVDGFNRYPTQLFSSAINFLVFLFLIWYYPRRRFPGQVLLIYLLIYPVYRFVIEFFRENWIFYGPLSPAQVYSILLFLVFLSLYWWRRNRNWEG